MNDKALILVDLQNDFLPGGTLAVPEGDQVIPAANRLMEGFEIIIATQDWHPPDHSSFASSHPGRHPFEEIEMHGLPQVLWPDHCVQGTTGADFAPGLRRERITKIFRKGTDPEIDSYSGFFDNGHRKSTGLGDWLRHKEVRRVDLCGLATDYCVKFTALDALSEGFEVVLHLEVCRGVNLSADDVDKAIAEMRSKGVKIEMHDGR